MSVRVPLLNQPGKSVTVEAGATKGATVGRDVYNADGSLFTPEAAGESATVDWSGIANIPVNVNAAANAVGTGFLRRLSAGEWSASALAYGDLPNAGAVEGDALVFQSGAWAPGASSGSTDHNRIDASGDVRIAADGSLRITR